MSETGQRAVLTTGANSGIGLVTAIEVAKRGFHSIGSVRSQEKADILSKAAADAGVTVEPVIMDVTDADRNADIIETFQPFGVINNAGFSITGAIEDVPDEEARHALETMVIAPMRLARMAIPFMRANKAGRIINVSSIYGRTTTPLTGWYQGCKHALEGLSDALRIEVAGDGIRVVLIEPGFFRTNIFDEQQRDAEKRAGSRFEAAYRRSAESSKLAQPMMGDPVQCAQVIVTALTTPMPQARYLVGFDAQAIAFADRFTPTALRDRLTRMMMGL